MENGGLNPNPEAPKAGCRIQDSAGPLSLLAPGGSGHKRQSSRTMLELIFQKLRAAVQNSFGSLTSGVSFIKALIV